MRSFITQAANICAVLAGLLLTFITVLTCSNLILRNTSGNSMAGAFEITGVATGAAIALFMPLCQIKQGHIIVDFFTTNLSDPVNNALDRIGALTIAVVFALLAWRTSLGWLNEYDAHSETQIMGFPVWVVYAAMVPPFILSSLIALYQTVCGFNDSTKE